MPKDKVKIGPDVSKSANIKRSPKSAFVPWKKGENKKSENTLVCIIC